MLFHNNLKRFLLDMLSIQKCHINWLVLLAQHNTISYVLVQLSLRATSRHAWSVQGLDNTGFQWKFLFLLWLKLLRIILFIMYSSLVNTEALVLQVGRGLLIFYFVKWIEFLSRKMKYSSANTFIRIFFCLKRILSKKEWPLIKLTFLLSFLKNSSHWVLLI